MNRWPSLTRRLVLAGLAGLATGPLWAAPRHRLFAASSLKPALDELFDGSDVALNYAGSGLLARQISVGVPASVFISANPLWMDEIETLAVAGTRRDLLGNRLVLVGRDAVALENIPAEARIATGLTEAVPLGQYARQALTRLGHWQRLSPALVQVENARLAVTLVARGEVEFGIVYASDVTALDRIVAQDIPAAAHDPIRYPVALFDEAARGVYDALFTEAARAVFARHGFEVL